MKLLKCTAQSLVKYRRNGDVPFYKLGGRYKYIESEILTIASTGGVKYIKTLEMLKEHLLELQALNKAEQKRKSPHFPEAYLVAKKYSDKTANDLTKAIVDYIRFKGGFATRVNTMGVYDRKTDRYRPSTSTKGFADINAVFNGITLYIEVKIGRDRLSDDQRKFKESVEQAGSKYFVAKDFENFYNWFNG